MKDVVITILWALTALALTVILVALIWLSPVIITLSQLCEHNPSLLRDCTNR